MTKIESIIRYTAILLIVGVVLGLNACSNVSAIKEGALRDRTYDYARYPVAAPKALVLPQGVDLNYQPKNQLPTGDHDYAAVASVNIAPPFMVGHQVLVVTKSKAHSMYSAQLSQDLSSLSEKLQQLKQQSAQGTSSTATVSNEQSSTVTSPSGQSSTATASNDQSSAATSPNDQSSATTTSTADNVTVTPSAYDTTKGQTQQQIGHPSTTTHTSDAVSTAQTTVVTATAVNQNGVPTLQAHASFNTVWESVAAALPKLDYHVVSSDRDKGYYFIASKADTAHKNTVLLYLHPQDGRVNVVLYDLDGNPDNSTAAVEFIHRLAKTISVRSGS